MRRIVKILHVALASAALATCAPHAGSPHAQVAEPERAASAIDVSAIDATCKPCDDFYSYANGVWLAQTKIPATLSSYGPAVELAERNGRIVNAVILDSAAAVRAGSAPIGSDSFKIGAFYDACVDTARADLLAVQPLKAVFDRIAAAVTPAEFMRVAGELKRSDQIGFIAVGVSPDQRDSNHYVTIVAFLGGLGLPNRDYYLGPDERYAAIRVAYLSHVQRMFELAGETPAASAAHAQSVVTLETELARRQLDVAAARDPRNTYNKITFDDLTRLTPHIPWRPFFEGMGAPPVADVNARYPESWRALDSLMSSVSLDEWKSLLRWELLHAEAAALSAPIVAEDFAFTSRLTGAITPRPRADVCTDETRTAMGDLIGKEYVRRAFPAATRDRARVMVDSIVSVLREQVLKFDGVSDSTRQAALAKVDSLRRQVGYPDEWQSYSGLPIEAGEYVENRRRLSRFRSDLAWTRLNHEVDKDAWGTSPASAGAFYRPPYNLIVTTAAMLQPPFFDPGADDAVNYGAIGAIIGHELMHAFDPIGRQFDAAGNQRDWWTKADDASYVAMTRRFIDQYNGYPFDSTHHVNGQTTLGENVADFGGLKLAYLAVEKGLQGKPRSKVGGFTREQRFFLSYAQVLRSLIRPEAALQMLNGTHSPAQWRVNGPLSRMPEFAAAWNCKSGDRMVVADRKP